MSHNLNYIENVADITREIFDIEIPIRNIDELVTKMGGYITYNRHADLEHVHIIKRGRGFEISLFEDSYKRKFYIAQSIGYLVLHSGYIHKEEWNRIPNNQVLKVGKNMDEITEANRFASALLMPKNVYKRIMKAAHTDNSGKVNTRYIADYFDVNVNEASHRGISLGYLKGLTD